MLLAALAEQPIAQCLAAARRGAAVAEQEEQRQQGKEEDHQAASDLAAIFARRFGNHSRVEPAEQRLGHDRIGEVGAPPIGDRRADDRQLVNPIGHGEAVVSRGDNHSDEDMGFVRDRDAEQDERRHEHDADD